MMKFFRKYNKHLLAVFMALLLIIWLGGSAIEDMMSTRTGNRVLGTAATGPITESDYAQAERETQLLGEIGLSWQMWQPRFAPMFTPKADERLGYVEWILLKREAARFGVTVTPAEAKAMMLAADVKEENIRRIAQQRDRRIDVYYAAAADYFSVQNMLEVYLNVTRPPEPELRRLARDFSEQATIEAVVFPAASFADPEQTFTTDELQRQFDAHKSARHGGGLNFGYYVEPKAKVQYIRVDPAKIKSHLRGSDQTYAREAYEYWVANKDKSNDFRWTLAEVEEYKKTVDVGSNGLNSNGENVPVVGTPYADFGRAQTKAVEAVKLAAAQAEAERIVNRALQVLRDPWYSIPFDPTTKHKPAPDAVRSAEYFTEIIAALPANLRYPEGIDVVTLEPLTIDQLTEIEGFGESGVPTDDDQFLRAPQLAFDVEGLADAPEEMRRDTSLHLSLWEPFSKPMTGLDGATYIFRVVETQSGHTPENLDEVLEQVTEDLRLAAGMKRAREAAEAFVANVGTSGLVQAWQADEELKAKVTPDRGGFVEPPPFPRDNSLFGVGANVVQPFGRVTPEFMDKAFSLAAAAPSNDLAVVDLPDEARSVVLQGVSLRPLYQEDFLVRREFLMRRFAQDKTSAIIGQWLNAKTVRERNKFEFSRSS